jgi:adenylate cyclase
MGVQYALEGSVRRAGNQIRVTAQLIDAIADHHLWGERYDRELKDIFALQEEISRKIIRYLAVRLTKEEQGWLWSRSVTTPETYDTLLRGWALFRRGTREANNQARQMFDRAIKLDPTYAEAYAAKGMTYWQEWWSQWRPDPRNLDHALALALKAKNLDDSSPLVHWLLAYVYVQKKQHEQAVAEAEQLIVLFPNSSWGYAALSLMLNFVGRPEEAIGWLEKALRLDPHYPVLYLWTLGQTYRLMGRYEEAIAVQKRVLDTDPNYLPAHVHLASIYSELSLEKEAQAEVTEILRLSPSFSMENITQRLPYKDPLVLERFLAALHKAGLT